MVDHKKPIVCDVFCYSVDLAIHAPAPSPRARMSSVRIGSHLAPCRSNKSHGTYSTDSRKLIAFEQRMSETSGIFFMEVSIIHLPNFQCRHNTCCGLRMFCNQMSSSTAADLRLRELYF
jgi:hypothetical protein